MRSTTTLLAAACTAALALGACGSSNDSGGSQLELVGRQADRVGAGHHRDAGDRRRPLPAHRPGGARLQRDPAGHRRLLQVRQRQRRRPRTQAQDDRPRRRLQPDQHGQGDQAARPAGQDLRDARRPRARRRTPRSSTSSTPRACPTSSSPRAACAGTSPRSIRRRSAGSPTTPSRARSSASTSPRTSRARRSPTSCRTTTSAPMAPRASTSTSPRSQVVTRQTYEPGNTDIGPQMAKIKASGRRGRRDVHDPGLHGARRAGRAQARLPPAARRQQRRLGPDDAQRAC